MSGPARGDEIQAAVAVHVANSHRGDAHSGHEVERRIEAPIPATGRDHHHAARRVHHRRIDVAVEGEIRERERERGTEEAEAHRILDKCLDAGINFFDTAEGYPVPPDIKWVGRTEDIVGRWMKGKNRDAIIMATKVSGPSHSWFKSPKRGGMTALDRHNIMVAVEDSLRKLQTDRGILHLEIGKAPRDVYDGFHDASKPRRMPFALSLEEFARRDWKTLEIGFFDEDFKSNPPQYTLWPGRKLALSLFLRSSAKCSARSGTIQATRSCGASSTPRGSSSARRTARATTTTTQTQTLATASTCKSSST